MINRKKLIASMTIFIIALIALIIAIIIGVLGNIGGIEKSRTLDGIMSGAIAVFGLLWAVSIILNVLYRKSSVRPGGLSTALLVFQCLFLLPIAIIMLIIWLVSFLNGISGDD